MREHLGLTCDYRDSCVAYFLPRFSENALPGGIDLIHIKIKKLKKLSWHYTDLTQSLCKLPHRSVSEGHDSGTDPRRLSQCQIDMTAEHSLGVNRLSGMEVEDCKAMFITYSAEQNGRFSRLQSLSQGQQLSQPLITTIHETDPHRSSVDAK